MDGLQESYEKLHDHLDQNKNDAVASGRSLLKVNETIWRLKHMLKHLMSYHEFLNQIRKEPECWMTQDVLEMKTSEIVQDYVKEKNTQKMMKEDIEKLEVLLDELEKICQLKSDINIEMTEITKKKEKVEILRQQFDAKYEFLDGKCSTHDEAKIIIEKQKNSIQDKLVLIDVLECDMKQARDDVNDNYKKLLIKLENLLFQNIVKTNGIHSSELALSLCEKFSGTKVLRKSPTSHELKIQYGQNNPKESEVSINTTFARQKPPYPTKLIDVKVNDCCVAVEDVTSRAILNNDWAALATELQLRFDESTSLSDEISELRKLSAIDWIPDENRLVVIIGNYKCTLFIPDGYPNSSCVQLRDIKGIHESKLAEMKPLQDEPSVSDWVNYLEMTLVETEE